MKKPKPQRSYAKMLTSLYQVLKINPDLESPFWTSGKTEVNELQTRQIRLGIWNIFKGNGGIRFLHDYRSFVYDLDLVLIQEALVGPHSLDEYCQYGLSAVHCASYERMDGLRDGVMTLSRWPVSDVPTRIRSLNAEPILKTPKVSLVTKYALPNGSELMVANMHSVLVRSIPKALLEVDQVIQEVADHEGPLIVAGDFNTFHPSYFQAISERLQSIGLAHVKIRQDPRKFPRELLDHIFMRGFLVDRAKVALKYLSSDHLPLKATLVF